MNINDIQTGDTFLTTNYKSFISKSIVKVMKYWGKKHYKIIKPIVLSHACRFAWIDNELYVYGSIDSGYKPWLFRLHYSLNNPNEGCIIMRRKQPLDINEKSKTIHYMQYLVTVSFIYQFTNFIKWLCLVYLNIDLFKISSYINKIFGTTNKILYCYQSEYMCRKNLNPENYGNTEKVDFFMLVNDTNYQIIYQNVK